MTRKMKRIIPFLFVSILCSCTPMQTGTATTYLPETFTTPNIMTVLPGMTSDEILERFGNPKNVRQDVCGEGKGTWTCVTWEYGKPPYDTARFTFDGRKKPMTLNDFDIDREDDSKVLPDTFSPENIMKIHHGMSAIEIAKTFGAPIDVRQAVCGSDTASGPWICFTWEYGNAPYQTASFTFGAQNGDLLLNNFNIDKN